MLPTNFVDKFTQALHFADYSLIHEHFESLLMADNFYVIAPEIHHLEIVFVICLAIKDRIRKRRS